MDKPVVKELIQNDLTANNITDELKQLLTDPKRQRRLLDDYEDLKLKLGNAGASKNAASLVVSDLKKKS